MANTKAEVAQLSDSVQLIFGHAATYEDCRAIATLLGRGYLVPEIRGAMMQTAMSGNLRNVWGYVGTVIRRR